MELFRRGTQALAAFRRTRAQVEDEREAAAAEDRPQDAQAAAPVMPAIKDPGLKAVAEMAQQNIWTDSSQGEWTFQQSIGSTAG